MSFVLSIGKGYEALERDLRIFEATNFAANFERANWGLIGGVASFTPSCALITYDI